LKSPFSLQNPILSITVLVKIRFTLCSFCIDVRRFFVTLPRDVLFFLFTQWQLFFFMERQGFFSSFVEVVPYPPLLQVVPVTSGVSGYDYSCILLPPAHGGNNIRLHRYHSPFGISIAFTQFFGRTRKFGTE